jgi:DNA-binding LacI/PurR family transcriptional regulator
MARSAEKTVTIVDIARQCGVSDATVSRALRGIPGKVSETVRERILAAATELGYDPSLHTAARRLVAHRLGQPVVNNIIVLFFPQELLEEPYYLAILRGILEVAREAHYGILLNYSAGAEEELLPLFARGEVDGILSITRAAIFSPVLARLRAVTGFAARPAVSLVFPVPGMSAVLTDDVQGGLLAADHLLRLGHRRILHFTEFLDTAPPVAMRYFGYQQACRMHGVDPDACLLPVAWDYADPQVLDSQLPALLEAHPDLTAILAPNDQAAQAIARVVRASGRRIPEELSLVGFDDSDPVLDSAHENILTTVRLPLTALGREAARLLLRQVHDEEAHQQAVTLPVELVVRTSTTRPHNRL